MRLCLHVSWLEYTVLKGNKAQYVSVNMFEEIIAICEREVDKQVEINMLRLIRDMASKYNISEKLLVRDFYQMKKRAVGSNEEVTQCIGKKRNGERCKNRPKVDGFCWHHRGQRARAPLPVINTVEHNHPFPPYFKEGCPACEGISTSSSANILGI